MDLRAYYQKIRKAMEAITGEFAVVVSLETTDGGKAGVKAEVTRHLAARLIVDSKARLATPEEAADHAAQMEQQRAALARESTAHRLQVALVSEESIAALAKERTKGKKAE